MPQIDPTSFLELVTFNISLCVFVFLFLYILVLMPQMSSLRARFDMFRISYVRSICFFLDKTNFKSFSISL